MAAKKKGKAKKSTRSKAKTVRSKKRSTKKRSPAKKQVDFMVQINEPVIVRRDVLEALRDIILFMQSYEHFKRVQEEKMSLFNSLRDQTKELNLLLSSQLKTHFPQGKLDMLKERQRPKFEDDEVVSAKKVSPAPKSPVNKIKPAPLSALEEHSEIDALEAQLQEIEGQLKKLD